MKARITVKMNTNNGVSTIKNGRAWAVISRTDIKDGIYEYAAWLQSKGFTSSANNVLSCIRLN